MVELVPIEGPQGQQPLHVLLKILSTGEAVVANEQTRQFRQFTVARRFTGQQTINQIAVGPMEGMTLG